MVRLAESTTYVGSRHDRSHCPVVYKWLRSNGYNKTDRPNITLLDSNVSGIGGKACVPFDMQQEFLREYAKTIKKGDFVYLNERLDAKDTNLPRRLYMDLDMTPLDDLTDVDEANLMAPVFSCIFDTVTSVCKNQSDEVATAVIILSSGYVKPNPLEHLDHCKLGYHLVWPNLIVDQSMSFTIRQAVVLSLGRTFGNNHVNPAEIPNCRLSSTWNDIVDYKVVLGQNLRMAYARKAKQNRVDKATKQVAYCVCGLRTQNPNTRDCLCIEGFLDLGRPYLPFAMIVLNQYTEPETIMMGDQVDPLVVLEQTCFTVDPGTEMTPLNIDCNTFSDEYASEVSVESAGTGQKQADGQVAEKRKPVDSSISAILDKYCRLKWRGYVGADPVTVTQGKGSISIALHSTMCCNAFGDKHASSGTYLTVFKTGLVVHGCWSKKMAKRRFRCCGQLAEDPEAAAKAHTILFDRITPGLIKLIFPPPSKSKSKTGAGKRKTREDDIDEANKENEGDAQQQRARKKPRRRDSEDI